MLLPIQLNLSSVVTYYREVGYEFFITCGFVGNGLPLTTAAPGPCGNSPNPSIGNGNPDLTT